MVPLSFNVLLMISPESKVVKPVTNPPLRRKYRASPILIVRAT